MSGRIRALDGARLGGKLAGESGGGVQPVLRDVQQTCLTLNLACNLLSGLSWTGAGAGVGIWPIKLGVKGGPQYGATSEPARIEQLIAGRPGMSRCSLNKDNQCAIHYSPISGTYSRQVLTWDRGREPAMGVGRGQVSAAK